MQNLKGRIRVKERGERKWEERGEGKESCNAMLANSEELQTVIYHISSLIFIPGSSIVLIMKAPPGMMMEGEGRAYERFRSCVTLTRLATNINVSVYEHTTHKQKWSCDYTRPQLLNCQTQSNLTLVGWLFFPWAKNVFSNTIWFRRGFPPFQATCTLS